ncbi:MAG: helix-turn-helix transcriptional regulator [Nitrospinae bacterium]|nr:helix-turn-helix transcriptional regulator [Nitrospinota bacterium]
MIVNIMVRTYGQNCPVAKSLDIFGDRWTLLVVRELLIGKTKYQEIMDALGGISPNLLSSRLKTLEAAKLVKRKTYEEHPRRMEYRLTKEGESLKFLLGVFIHWGGRHFGHEMSLVHEKCGGDLEIRYHCPACDGAVDNEEVNILRKTHGKAPRRWVFKEYAPKKK